MTIGQENSSVLGDPPGKALLLSFVPPADIEQITCQIVKKALQSEKQYTSLGGLGEMHTNWASNCHHVGRLKIDYEATFLSSSWRSEWAISGLALPFVFRITWPTKNVMAVSFPFRKSSTDLVFSKTT